MVEEERDRTPPVESDDEPFLFRWSRRKHAARQEWQQQAQEQERREEGSEETPAAGATGSDDAPVADESGEESAPAGDDLPPPESLGADSDFSAYLSRRVSSGLRRAAMRRLFSLPDFNVRDGLDDYDEDYTGFQSLGKIVTAQMKHHEERLRERERQQEQERHAAASGREDAETEAPAGADAADTTADAGDARPTTGSAPTGDDPDEESDDRT